MGTSFKNYKSRLHGHFLECNEEDDLEKAKGLKPTDTNISEEVWHALCNYWSSDTFRENMIVIRRQADMEGSIENSLTDLEIMQQVLGKRPAYIRGWSRVPSTRSDSATSRQSTGSSTRLSYSEMSSRLVAIESELASTRSELGLIKDEMSELRQMMRSFASSHSFPDFSSGSLNVQAQNLEDGSETDDLGIRY